jgi:hypothetical protein
MTIKIPDTRFKGAERESQAQGVQLMQSLAHSSQNAKKPMFVVTDRLTNEPTDGLTKRQADRQVYVKA